MNQSEPIVSSPRISTFRPRSRIARWMMIFGIGSAGTVFLCCLSSLAFNPEVTYRQEDVDAIVQRIAPLKRPESFRSVVGIVADNSLFWIQVAKLVHREGRGQMIIGEVHMRSFFADEKNDATLFEVQMNIVGAGLRLLDVKEKEERTVNIHGKDCKFEILRGEDRASTTKLKQVTGVFPGRVAPAHLILQAEEGFLTDQAIDELLQSLTVSDEHPAASK